MGSEIEKVEERLKSFLAQLQTEYGILDRIVYKNKNQHRRCAYFQYLLKVRRDLRLLQSAKLEEILNSSFLVIHGKRPKQKVQLLESLKRRRCDGGKFNFLERLLGVARLLSQMVEPMLKAAINISKLLAQSFFMGFSLTVLSLLARLRVLIQQILLDVVCIYNIISSVSRKEQAIKITEKGFEAFREYYPMKEQFISLECTWQTDKYVLVEKMNEGESKSWEDGREDVSQGTSAVQYQSIEVLLEDNETGKVNPVSAPEGPNDTNNDIDLLGNPLSRQSNEDASGSPLDNDTGEVNPESAPESPNDTNNDIDLLGDPLSQSNEEKCIEGSSSSARPPEKSMSQEDGLLTTSSSFPPSNPLKRKPESKERVAFLPVTVPPPSTGDELDSHVQLKGKVDEQKEDPFFSLLTSGSKKSSIF